MTSAGHAGVFFDFSGCDPQRRAPVNSSLAMTFSACAYALRALMDKDLPINHGFYQFVRLNAPRGSVVNVVHPGAVVGGWETQIRINDLLFKALSQAMPEAVAAGCKAMMAQAGFGVIDRKSGEYHCNYEALAGGYGGRATKDGPDAVQGHGQNTENAPVEEVEINYPVRINRLSLIEDSEGPGKFRGGLGLRRDYHFPRDAATFTILSDRDREGPWGLFGGQPGRKAYYVLNPDGPSPRQLTSKCVVQLRPGDTVSFQTPGGGGYGDPRERDAQLVLKDIRDGKVSAARARELYGVDVVSRSRTVAGRVATHARRRSGTS
jgi:N-methylhydantoinase B